MIDLKEGEIVCDKCSGIGHTEVKYNYINQDYIRGMCPKCFGRGKLDWIENITGMNQGFLIWDTVQRIKPDMLITTFFKSSLKLSEQEEQKNSQPDRIVFRKLIK